MEHLCTRRELMKGVGMAGLALGLESLYEPVYGASSEIVKKVEDAGKCRQPPLAYPYDALEPFIDKETMAIHYEKHHAGYVKKFNTALLKLSEARKTGKFDYIKHWSKELAFNGSGHVLHSLYWANMAPHGDPPQGELSTVLEKNFGGLESFKKQFIAATNAVEGSGWGILAYEPFMGKLIVLQAEKHQDLTIWGSIPIMVCDVWEHAYYLKYRNRRGEYIENFFKIINWKEVEKRYSRLKRLAGYR